MSNYTLTYKKNSSQEIRIESINDMDKNSLYFEKEYRNALTLINDIVDLQQPSKEKWKINKLGDYGCNNRILFTGPRGCGKTSVMSSLAEYLDCKSDVEFRNGENKVEKICGSFKCLPMVDPSHFDNNNNILLTVITSMFSEAKKQMNKSNGNEDVNKKREELLTQFEKVFKSLEAIKSDVTSYTLETLNRKSDAEDMKSKMRSLVKKYLDFLSEVCDDRSNDDRSNKKHEYNKLILMIDDIDMTVSHASEMLEQIRKYLELDNLIILMSANLDQLYNEMREHYSQAFKGTLKHSNQASIDVEDLASKYLLKLFPTSRRIRVEHRISQLLKTTLKIEKEKESEKQDDNKPKQYEKKGLLQNVILTMIWEKTRLLYIPKDAKSILHPIIPTNLRELAQFLDMLTSLKEVKYNDNEGDESLFLNNTAYDNCKNNFGVFRNYILNVWIPNHLSIEEESVFKNIPSDITEVNKHLINSINVIGTKHKARLMSREVSLDMIERNAEGVNIDRDIYTMVSPNDPRFVKANKISDIFNQPSNYSYGDLLLMIDKYETYFESEEDRNFTDAIKIYYSMLLFETMFFKSKDVEYKLDRYKVLFYDNDDNKIIPIQRLIGGTVYYPNYFEIITDKNFNQKGPSFDAKRAFYHKLKVKEDGSDVNLKCPLFSVLYYGDIRPDRYEKKHIYDTIFKNDADVDGIKYVTFDILSVLNNMLNPWHTVLRWKDTFNVVGDFTTRIKEWCDFNTVHDSNIAVPNSILPFYSVDIMLQYLTHSFSIDDIVNLAKKQDGELLSRDRKSELNNMWEGIRNYNYFNKKVVALLNKEKMFYRKDEEEPTANDIANIVMKDGSNIGKAFTDEYDVINGNYKILKQAYNVYKNYSLTYIESKNKLPERVSMTDSFRNYLIALILQNYKGSKRERGQLIKSLHKYNTSSEVFEHLVSVLWCDALKDIGVRKSVQDTVHSYAFVNAYYNELWKRTEKLFSLCKEEDVENENIIPKQIYKKIFNNAKKTFLEQ